jgi:hypothetical protein
VSAQRRAQLGPKPLESVAWTTGTRVDYSLSSKGVCAPLPNHYRSGATTDSKPFTSQTLRRDGT